jgi:hypothetical protein
VRNKGNDEDDAAKDIRCSSSSPSDTDEDEATVSSLSVNRSEDDDDNNMFDTRLSLELIIFLSMDNV